MSRKLAGLLAAIAAATSLLVMPALANGRVALVIGNAAYERLTRLNNPTLDAARMASILESNGFDVLSCNGQEPGCFDLDREGMTDALEDFEEKAEGAELAFVFYAGHGLQTADGNVLAPVNMELSCDTLDPKRALLLDRVLQALEGAAEKIVIVDACRNDPFGAHACAQRGARPLSFDSIALPASSERFLLMSSTKPGQLAQDGLPGAHSPFARILFEMMEKEPALNFDQLLDRATKRVIEDTTAANFTQVPEVLIRGGAPEACLRGKDCHADPLAALLKDEVQALRLKNERAQEYEAIVVALLKEAGYASLDVIPAEQRASVVKGILDAGRALAARGDSAGEKALEALKQGDESAAERLFHQDIQANLAAVDASRKLAADSHRHLAALAWPKDVSKAAHHFREAARLDPEDIQTWMDVAATSKDVGNTSEALRAFIEASRLALDAGSDSQRFSAAVGEGDIVLARGRLDRALTIYQIAQSAAKERSAAAPDDVNARRDLAVSHERIGDVLVAKGNLAGALVAYRATLAIYTKFAAGDPGNAEWQRDLSVSHNKIGDVRVAQGDLAGALAAFEASLDIRTELAASDRGNAGWQRDLSVSHSKIGDVRVAQGDLAGALTAYRADLDIRTKLVADDPGNAAWRRDLSVSRNKIGDVLMARGDLAGALAAYQAGLDIRTKLVADDPGNAGWQRDLSVSRGKIGDVLVAKGDLDGGLAAYSAGLDIAQKLVAGDPGNVEWQRDLSINNNRIGDVLRTQGDLAGALAAYRAALDISEKLAASDLGHAEWQYDLFISYWRFAKYGDHKVEHYEKALQILEKLEADGRLAPSRVKWIQATRQRLAEARGEASK